MAALRLYAVLPEQYPGMIAYQRKVARWYAQKAKERERAKQDAGRPNEEDQTMEDV